MAEEVKADLLLGRDTLTPGFIKAGKAASDAAGNVKQFTRDLYDLNKQRATPVVELDDDAAKAKYREVLDRLQSLNDKVANPGVDLNDKDAKAKLAAFRLKLDTLARTVTPDIKLGGLDRAAAGVLSLEAQLDKLDHKTATVTIRERLSKLGESDFFKPSGIGTAVSLLPTLIPIAGGVTAAVGAIGASFGAAGLAAGLFGLAVKSVLSTANSDLQKYNALQAKLAVASTAAQKKAVQQQIASLTAGWSKSYFTLIGDFQNFQHEWKGVAQAIAVPALIPWLNALTKGMEFLKPLVEPVAQEFAAWGKALDQYFSSKTGSTEISHLATSLGQFASLQLADIVQFIRDLGTGVFNLGKDLSANGVYFGSFGDHLAKWGDAFASWSRSKSARDDVQKFLNFIQSNGGRLVSFVSQLAKDIPGIFAGASAVGRLELDALTGLLKFINGLGPGWAKPLTEAAGALLLLSKTGVIKVGFKIAGVATDFIKKLLGGGTVDIGAAGMQRAGDTMVTAAAAMQKAADTMAGASGEGALGGAAGAGESVAGRGTLAALGAASAPVAVGVLGGLTIAWMVNSDAASRASAQLAAKALKQNNLTPGNVATGKQTGGVVSGVPASAIGSWKQYDEVVGKTGQTIQNLTGVNKALAQQFEQALIPDLNRLHANTPQVRTDMQNFAAAILNAGSKSSQTKAARQQLITDLENAGASSKQARALVANLTSTIQANAATDSKTHQSRQQLIDDVQSVISKAPNATGNLRQFTNQIVADAQAAQKGRISRQQLISDIEQSGQRAHLTQGQIANMIAKILKIPKSEALKIVMTGTGSYSLSQINAGTGKQKQAAAGWLVPGSGNRDTVPILATPGEAVVPKHLVPAVAPLLRSHAVPGFASGGLVPGVDANGNTGVLSGQYAVDIHSKFTKQFEAAMVASMRAGIKKAEAALASLSGGPTSANAAAAQRYAASILGHYGWGASQMPPLIALWNRESGWSRFAYNAGSGATGIPQALPYTKMPRAAWLPFQGGQASAASQIQWGLGYIKTRPGYGSPAAAWAHEVQYGWYDNGGYLPPGVSIAVNKTGYPEQVIPSGKKGGGVTVIELRAGGGDRYGQFLLTEIQRLVSTRGGGDVQVTFGRSS